MLGVVDRWIGRTLFVPPIIWACQRLRISQYQFHNYGYLLGSYFLLAGALETPEADESVAFALVFLFTVLYGLNPHREGYDGTFLRRSFIGLNVLHVIAHVIGEKLIVVGPDWSLSCPAGIIWLAAEYARTIKTIPPLEENTRDSDTRLLAETRSGSGLARVARAEGIAQAEAISEAQGTGETISSIGKQ